MMELVRGSVMTLSRSGASSPPWMLKESIMSLVSLYSIPDATSRGSSTSTDSQLKKSWTVAPPNALEPHRGKRIWKGDDPRQYDRLWTRDQEQGL